MEVKGIGQRIPKPPPDPHPAGRFEVLFDQSKRNFNQARPPDPDTLKVEGKAAEGCPIDVARAKHLASNPLFVSLQNWMEEFYGELKTRETGCEGVREDETPPDYHLRLILYGSLNKLMREIVSTKDHVLQSSYLQRVHAWFVRRQERAIRSSSPMKKEMGIVPEKDIPAPKRYIVEIPPQKLYEQKMRTLHPEIPPPQARLGEYNCKEIVAEQALSPTGTAPLLSQSSSATSPTAPPAPSVMGQSQSQSDFRPESAAIMSSPQLSQFMVPPATPQEGMRPLHIAANSTFLYYRPSAPEEQKVERMWFARKNREIAEKRVAEEFQKTVSEWGTARARINENIVRKFENSNYGNNFSVRNQTGGVPTRPHTTFTAKREADYKQVYDQVSSSSEDERDSASPSPRPISKGRKIGKLPEIVDLRSPTSAGKTASTFGTASVSALNSIRQGATATTAARSPTKLQSPKKGSSPAKKLPVQSKAAVQNKIRIPQTVLNSARAIGEADKMRVDYIRKMYGNIIGETHDSMDTAANIFLCGPKGVNTLSLYNRDVKRPYTARGPQGLARGVPITHQGSREQFRVSQIKEINRLKQHLASEEIPCSALSLERAILVPEDFPAFRMTAQNFLTPGSRLFVNPFAAGKRKKKKGKGKAKKAKK